MKVKRLEVVKDRSEPKSIYNIQVFLGFTNFYWQFIQDFNKIAVPLISILKMTKSPYKLALSKNNGSKSTFSKNSDSKPTSEKNDSNNELDRFGDDAVEHTKNSRKSKGKKSAKSRKLSKSKDKKLKKPSKSRNLLNFNATMTGPSFLTFDAKIAFNCLWLAFIEAPILRHFDWKCYIWIETNALRYSIGRVLSQLTPKTSPNKVITKADIG